MEKRMKNTLTNNLVFLAVLTLVSVPALAVDDGYALLVQQSPPNGGSVNLAAGVHTMEIGQTVSLSATPKPGYRFVYWLGDVAAADAMETSIQIDSPKMVVAVFTRNEFDDEELRGNAGGIADSASGGFGGGGQRGTNPVTGSGGVSPAVAYGDVTYPSLSNTDTSFNNETDGVAVAAPEPATLLLLGMGSTVLMRRKQK